VGGIARALGVVSPEEQKAENRLKVLQAIDIEDPDSLLQGARHFLESGDPEAAFGLANRAGGLRDKALEVKSKESEIALQGAQKELSGATTAQQKAETKLLGKRELGQRTQFEQILGNSDFPDEVKNKLRDDYLRALIEVTKGKGESAGKPRTGSSATSVEKDAVVVELNNRGLTKSTFDNTATYDDYKNKVANLAKAVIKADNPLTTDYAEAVATVVDMLNEEKALKDTGFLPGDVENVLDPTAIERVRARLGVGGVEGAPPAASTTAAGTKTAAAPEPAAKPRRRITLTQ
jgi:hypothetical protein